MLAANPEIRTELDAVKAAQPKLRDDRAWLLTILRNPRFGILVNSPDYTDALEAKRDVPDAIDQYDHNDKNWWCPLETDRQLGAIRSEFDEAAGLNGLRGYDADQLKPVIEPDGLARAEAARDALLKAHPWIKGANWSEVAALARAPSAPTLLGKAAVRWSKVSRGQDGAPEALAKAVVVSHYGCNWHGGTGAVSKAAHDVLQAKFKDTSWAKETPYWFNCMDSEWDKDGNKIAVCKPKTWPKQAPLN
jgi:hypothetical protein